MNDATYLSVIHKDTEKIITAFQLENDATWIGKEKDKLIATPMYCNPGEEVEMVFVKSFARADGKSVYADTNTQCNQTAQVEVKDYYAGT